MSILREGAARGAAAPARLRVGPWRGGGGAAYIVPAGDALVPLEAAEVIACLRSLARRGYTAAYTSALGPADSEPFLDAGFREVKRLHLLSRPLDETPLERAAGRSTGGPDDASGPGRGGGGRGRPGDRAGGGIVDLRRARRRDREAVLAVDRAAFDRFWHLDEIGLTEALTATPAIRFRVATAPSAGVVGYAISGRSRRRGYLQRLAVHPDHQGRGTGTELVLDGLRWLRRRGAREAVINTQEENERSLRLYQRCGFVLRPGGLAVLRADLAPEPGPPAHDGAERA